MLLYQLFTVHYFNRLIERFNKGKTKVSVETLMTENFKPFMINETGAAYAPNVHSFEQSNKLVKRTNKKEKGLNCKKYRSKRAVFFSTFSQEVNVKAILHKMTSLNMIIFFVIFNLKFKV